ncbi:oligosaccharide flippase family protein [Flavobacterium rakeshii]|uniref:lipopolysaccharide biosynthesis protein n=1 Tax=Flavobacterium rakeshii TaxID=1038845 RepID=UPI002E7B71C1|nr:oligosaccharide flippase family protein [Flavobacterium rakeshii]MEE1896845.1 oligosaccharide flippase family protein [Flavobacterium rakeshii]
MFSKILKLFESVFVKFKNPTFIGEFFYLLLNILYSFILTRGFGIELYGSLIVLMTISGFFTDVIGVRSNEVIVYFLNKSNDNNVRNSFYTMSVLTDVILGTIISLVVFLLSGLIVSFFEDKITLSSVKLLSVYSFFLYMRGTNMGVMQFFAKFKILALIKNIELILRFSLMFLFYYFGFKDLKSLTFMMVIPCVIIFFSSIFIIRYNREINLKLVSVNFSVKKSIYFCVFSWRNFLSTIIKAGNKQIDSLIVAKFISITYVGVYDLVKKFSTPINLVSNVLIINMLPEIIKNKKREGKLFSRIKKINKRLLLFFLIWLVVLMLSNSLIERFLLIEYSMLIFSGLLIVNFLNQIMWWTRAFSTAYNQKLSIYFNGLATLLSCTVLIFLVVNWDIWGLIGGLFFIRILLYYLWNQKLKQNEIY